MQIGVCHGKEFERNVFSSIKPMVEEYKLKISDFFRRRRKGGGGGRGGKKEEGLEQ